MKLNNGRMATLIGQIGLAFIIGGCWYGTIDDGPLIDSAAITLTGAVLGFFSCFDED